MYSQGYEIGYGSSGKCVKYTGKPDIKERTRDDQSRKQEK
jgi:hypothetical protein